MKSKYLIVFFFIFLCTKAYGQSIQIQSKNISINKNDETTIFENEVVVKTEKKTITSDFAKYDKKKGFLILRKNIVAKDSNNNIIEADYAEYSEIKKIFITTGQTKITTSENYTIEAEDILFDNKNRFINSKKKSILKDLEGNIIYLENFEYLINENIFKSIGYIKIEDQKENVYEFSQIYIDTKKKEILGTDIKSYLKLTLK
jgi:lipopolysaccharide export system protein LptA